MMQERIAALLRNGQAVARTGERAAARRNFRAVLALDPGNTTALLWMAWLSDDPRASLAYITRVLARDPENPQAHAALRWARRRASSTPPRESHHPAPGLRLRWGHVAAGAALVILVAIVASALLWLPTSQPPVSAAFAPRPHPPLPLLPFPRSRRPTHPHLRRPVHPLLHRPAHSLLHRPGLARRHPPQRPMFSPPRRRCRRRRRFPRRRFTAASIG